MQSNHVVVFAILAMAKYINIAKKKISTRSELVDEASTSASSSCGNEMPNVPDLSKIKMVWVHIYHVYIIII